MEKKDFIIVESGNKQIITGLNHVFEVDKLDLQDGQDQVSLKLIFDGKMSVNKEVKCQVISPMIKKEKKLGLIKRRRKHYEKRISFRPMVTQLKILKEAI